MDAYKEAIRRFQCVYRYPMSCDVHGVDMPEQDIQQLAEYWAAENDPSKVPSFLKNCDTCGQVRLFTIFEVVVGMVALLESFRGFSLHLSVR